MSPLFIQPFVQAQIKENIKAPRHLPLYGEFTGDRWIPAQRASNTENVTISWRHHVLGPEQSRPQQITTQWNLQWRHISVMASQLTGVMASRVDSLFNSFIGLTSKETPMPRKPLVTVDSPRKRPRNSESVSMSWRHHYLFGFSAKTHNNASDKYPTMDHFVTEMCTHGHISVTKWCIVGYRTGVLWDLCNRCDNSE